MRRPLIIASLVILLLMVLVLTQVYAARPENVILMIGDGMGIGPVTAARLSLSGANARMNMDSMRYTALVNTQAADRVVTDSAAAGTALATGFKTNCGVIGMTPDGKRVRSILEAAERLGKSTGLVTTTTITHATPASFGSHVESRGEEADIAPQYLDADIEVLMGGGRSFFVPKTAAGSGRKDDLDLLAKARTSGYTVVDTREGLLNAAGNRILGLFAMDALSGKSPEPSLAEMTDKAIRALSTDRDGFFLMVEGGQIDWAGHANLFPENAMLTLDFDAAVGRALEFARKNGHTLVIVTADHDTGGLSVVNPPEGDSRSFGVKWAEKGHTANSVPLFADGPGAETYKGMIDNTDVPKKIARLWKVRSFGQPD